MLKYRNTRQKELILSCLKNHINEHITSDIIFDTLKSIGTPVSKATIYRYLIYLEKNEIVRKYLVDGQESACYQYIDDQNACSEHYHLICSKCNETIHFQNEKIKILLDEINHENNFKIDPSKTIFYGVCKNCKKKRNEK